MNNIAGTIPYRLALAGGWIDQPFISRFNPSPPGSMVVVAVQPDFRFMERCGMATSTRRVAEKIWKQGVPKKDPSNLVKELYFEENKDKEDPSGSQDMIGILYPGINRLDFDIRFQGGLFPVHIETCKDPNIVKWLEKVIHVLPVFPRPLGYNPLGKQKLDPEIIEKLGCSGRACFEAILSTDIQSLGESMNQCMVYWEHLLPCVVRHELLTVDLLPILEYYQSRYYGAMYSGCGGGYLYVVSDNPVPGSFSVRIKV